MKADIAPKVLALLLSVYLSRVVYAEHDFRVDIGFPGGSAEIVRIDPASATVHIQPTVHWEQGFPCWWYLRLSGLVAGKEFIFKISANPRPFRRNDVLNRSWSQPANVAMSTDNVHWIQTGGKYELQEDGTAVYRIEAPQESIWLAWGPPYLPSHAEALLASVAKTCRSSERFTLAKTRGHRPVPAIRIGGGSPEEPAQYGVWIQARQHAWETGSSWVAHGFLKWVASDEPDAKLLRSMATIWLVPIMDVDRVVIGAGGKESVPRDHNRDWDNHPYYPAVAAAQSHLAELQQAGKLDFFLDIHNPGDDKLLHYFYGPKNLDTMPPLSKRNNLRWLASARRTITEPLPVEQEYKFINYIKTQEESNRISTNWVRRHCDPHVVATTFEAASNTPHSTQQGYQIAGRQLAQAMKLYLQENPRRESHLPGRQ